MTAWALCSSRNLAKTRPHALAPPHPGLSDHGPGAVIGQTGRHRQAQFAASRLLPFALMQAQPDLVQFRFAHDAGQAEQQTVMIGTRIEQTLAIGDQHPEQRAQFQQLMPVAVVARQP